MIEDQINFVFLPEPIFVRLCVLKLQVPHINIHEGSARIEMCCLAGNYSDIEVAALSYFAGSRDARNTVTDYYYVLHTQQRLWCAAFVYVGIATTPSKVQRTE